MCCVQAQRRNSMGNPPAVTPGWVFKKPWQQPKKQAGGRAKLAVLWQTLNLIPANIHTLLFT